MQTQIVDMVIAVWRRFITAWLFPYRKRDKLSWCRVL